MLLRRLLGVAPAVATSRAFVASAGSTDSEAIIAAIGDLASRMASMESKMVSLESKMDKMESKIDKMESKMDSRMDKLESKMDSVEERARSTYDGWFRSTEKVIYASMIAGFVALGLVTAMQERELERQLSNQAALKRVELQAVESLTASKTCNVR